MNKKQKTEKYFIIEANIARDELILREISPDHRPRILHPILNESRGLKSIPESAFAQLIIRLLIIKILT
jgi:hypothetical protein